VLAVTKAPGGFLHPLDHRVHASRAALVTPCWM
jgi:hypothetical protein